MRRNDSMTHIPGRRHHVMGTRLTWIYCYIKNLQYPDEGNEVIQEDLMRNGRQIFGPTLEAVMDRVQRRLRKKSGWR